MGFGSIKGFVDGFKTGYNLIPDLTQEEKDQRAISKRAEKNESQRAEGERMNATQKDYMQSDAPTTGSRYRDAIASIESGGRYDAVGPTHEKYGRALGKYQVMESNLPSWSREALGKEITPDEFLKNPQYQDKIFDVQFGKNIQRYGSAADAASVWHSGVPLSQAQNRRDSLGTRTPDYVSRFSRSLGSGAAPAVPVTATGVGPQASLDNVDDPDAVDENGNRIRPGVYAAEGGIIDEPQERSALPVQQSPDQAITGPSPYSSNQESDSRMGGATPAAPREVRQSDLTDHRKVVNAVDDGMKYIQGIFGFDQPAGVMGATNPRQQQGLQAFARNVGAATEEEVQAVDQTVDPHGRLSEERKALARLNAGYDYYMEKGQPGRAQQYAASMLMYVKKNVAMAGALAQTAAENRDVQGMADAIAHGKDQIPDGESVKVKRVTPQGAEFQVFDADGRVTSEGKATVDDMMRIATGMQNGTAWFEEIGAIKGKSAAERKTESERAAIDEFESSRIPDEGEFIAQLSDTEKKKFLAMPRSAQNMYRRDWNQKVERERKQGNIEDRIDRDLENRDYKRDWDMFKMSVAQGRWEDQRERAMTEHERALAQRDRDLDDRNNRFSLSQEARDKRNLEIDQRILQTRKERQAAAQAKAASGPRDAAGRADAQVDEQAAGALGRIADSPEAAPTADDAGQPVQALPLRPGDVQGTENYGPTLGQKERADTVTAGAAFQKTVNNPGKRRDFDQAKFASLDEQVGALWDANKDRPGYKPLAEPDRLALSGVASDITRGNDIDERRAAMIALTATNPAMSPKVLEDGRVLFDPRLPPVKVSEDAMMQLAMIRGRARAVTPAGNGQGRNTGASIVGKAQAAAATPGATAPTSTPASPSGTNTTTAYTNKSALRMNEDRAARVAATTRGAAEVDAERLASKKGEEAQLIQELGDDYIPGMTMKQMRQAINDRITERGLAGKRRRALDINTAIRDQARDRGR